MLELDDWMERLRVVEQGHAQMVQQYPFPLETRAEMLISSQRQLGEMRLRAWDLYAQTQPNPTD